jgi:hypothetical protein
MVGERLGSAAGAEEGEEEEEEHDRRVALFIKNAGTGSSFRSVSCAH